MINDYLWLTSLACSYRYNVLKLKTSHPYTVDKSANLNQTHNKSYSWLTWRHFITLQLFFCQDGTDLNRERIFWYRHILWETNFFQNCDDFLTYRNIFDSVNHWCICFSLNLYKLSPFWDQFRVCEEQFE